ncbi:MAG: hypothetical protein IKY67_10005 [Paludibacteraceae bacterium]|nr:hypothetical protein [Paludibacteraceae bacterium]
MKYNLKYLMFGLLALVFASCDKHDNMDDIVHVGEMAPHVHWTVPNTVVSAGSDVAFSVQYYTTEEDYPISHLEVWYDVHETVSKNVSAPWVVSTPYTIASEISTIQRISTCIKRFEHNEDNYNTKERAYKFEDGFPTSNTLGRVTWSGAEFTEDKANVNFGENFMQNFKDSLYNYLVSNPDAAYKDFAKLVSTDSIWNVDLFLPYKTTSFDENSQTNYDHFVDHVIPAPLDSLFKALSFEDIIDDGKGNLNISYSRSYLINAQLKCLDTKGTAGLTKLTTINLN